MPPLNACTCIAVWYGYSFWVVFKTDAVHALMAWLLPPIPYVFSIWQELNSVREKDWRSRKRGTQACEVAGVIRARQVRPLSARKHME